MLDEDLKDLFAMLAMQELLRSDLQVSVENQNGQRWIAQQAYALAEVMIEEKRRGNNKTKTTSSSRKSNA